ncbi:MAG: YcxB family protein [bacterium]
MSEICKAKYRWTREELRRSMLHHYRLQMRRVLLLMRIFSVVLLTFIGIVLVAWWALEPSTSDPPFWALLLLTIFCLYSFFIVRLNAWNASRGFAKRPDVNAEIEWQFSSDGVKTRTELGEATTQWRSFLKVSETGDGFLFYSLKNFFHWLPFSAFESPECIETVRQMIKENRVPLVGPNGRTDTARKSKDNHLSP